ncbi:MAG TPA: CARDB domain-containing protein, partial [Thermoplasmata archaeon]|nr:CARDB domain-containing protein [Thermoplasmata archaeon]
MSDVAGRNGAALSLLIVVSLVLGGLFASVLVMSPAARAAACDQVGGVITGDWTITTAQVCSGILYSVDGTININSGGSLTLVDGGLSFSKDQLHAGYALNVNAGGELVLDHSIVTTQTDAISPYVKLALTVSGANSRFKMIDGSSLKFPGWFNATGATLNISSSKITGFTDSDIAGLGIDTDDNNDAPTMSWASTSASIFASRIERLYEYTSGPNGTGSMVLGLTAGTSVYAYDTYIGLDFSDVVGWHNTLSLDGTSNAYLYNVTIDRSQDPASMSDFLPAYVPTAAGGSVYLLRWAHVTTYDSTAFPVSGAAIASTLSPSAGAAQYPDNGFATTPTTRTIWYLGRTSSGNNAWDQTDSSGTAVIPLYTDQITTASLPNAESFGNYEEVATFSSYTQTAGAFFPPYPAINAPDNNIWITMTFPGLQVRTGPDLVLQAAPGTMTVVQNQAFTVYALITNSGQTAATNAAVAAFPNGIRGNEVARATGINVAAGGFVNRSMSIPGMALTGPATLELIVDPDNVINEGGVAQEGNNFANITLNVIPPPEGFTAILSPENGQSFEPGKDLSVTGYVRDTASNSGLEGVPLTIELRSGSTLIATNSTVSGSQGFFIGTFTVPSGTQDGTYTVVVTPASSTISSDQRTISLKTPGSILNQIVPILGIPFWLLFVMIAAAVAVAIGVTMYWKVYGLGKMVECGECGAFIPEDATSCPKCGVEFEKDMAKCSNCQA